MFEYNFNFVKNFPHLMFSRFSKKQIYSDEFFYINFFSLYHTDYYAPFILMFLNIFIFTKRKKPEKPQSWKEMKKGL